MVRPKKKKSQEQHATAQARNSNITPIDFQLYSEIRDDVFDGLVKEVEDYAIIMLDRDGIILTWNKGAEKIKGYSAGEIIGKNYRIFYTKEDKEQRLSEKLLEEAARIGKKNYEGWRVRKDGVRFWGSVTLTALHTSDGDIKGFLKITRDLTQKKTAEDNYSNFVEELKLKNEELKQSEERYHKMVGEVTDYAIILLDKDGKILDWNKGAEKVKGYTAKEILGKSFRLFYPKEEKDAKLPERLLAEARKYGSVTHEGWRIRKDGQRFWGNITITALHGDNGDVIGYTKVTRDLTEKKVGEDKISNIVEELRQVNEELKKSEERYYKMISEVQDYAILLLDPNGIIKNWNTGAEVIKGYQHNEVIGQHFRIFYPKEDREKKVPDRLLEIAARNGKANHEGWRVRKDGTRFWGSVVITALHDSNGNIIGYSKVTRDLTERKKAEDALKASAAQLDLKNKSLERLNEDLSSFTHVASHDLKEPLRKIQTFISRIEETGFDTTKTPEYLGKIKASAQRMQELIEDLLSLAGVSNDDDDFEKVDLNKTLLTVKNDLEVSLSEKKAVLDAGKLPVVRGIPSQLHQLFLNLISNSLKFSKKDVHPKIVIRSKIISGPEMPGFVVDGENKFHHIAVSDDGIGFESKHADLIFEPFQRLNPKNSFPGSGLGLAIVKKVVQNHHGIITAESDIGEGATFHIYLPLNS